MTKECRLSLPQTFWGSECQMKLCFLWFQIAYLIPLDHIIKSIYPMILCFYWSNDSMFLWFYPAIYLSVSKFQLDNALLVPHRPFGCGIITFHFIALHYHHQINHDLFFFIWQDPQLRLTESDEGLMGSLLQMEALCWGRFCSVRLSMEWSAAGEGEAWAKAQDNIISMG